MTRALRRALSHFTGWAADRRVPRWLRPTVYGGYCSITGACTDEVRLALADFPSLSAFFVRELKAGARPLPTDPEALPSPVEGTVQSLDRVRDGLVLQAKGRPYRLAELLGGLERGLDLEGGFAWTIYLSPRDYHRIHAPIACALTHVRWIDGERFSVAPKVLLKRRVLDVNERAVLRLESERGTLLLVLVGALNVGRIRVVGVEPSYSETPLEPRTRFARGAEIARFEMGSTIVLVAPRGSAEPDPALEVGASVRLNQSIGRLVRE